VVAIRFSMGRMPALGAGLAAAALALPARAADLATVDLSFDPHSDTPALTTLAEGASVPEPASPVVLPPPPYTQQSHLLRNPLQRNIQTLAQTYARAQSTSTIPAPSGAGAVWSATTGGLRQKTGRPQFSFGIKPASEASASNLASLTDSLTVFGKFSFAHTLPHYPAVRLNETVHLGKKGLVWEGGLGLSVHWHDSLTLYGDASVHGSLLRVDVKDISANIGVRVVF